MKTIEEEVKYRLGDLYSEKIEANAKRLIHLPHKGPHIRCLNKDLSFFSKLIKEDFYIPIESSDMCYSKNGYVFSYSRSNGDSKVGLLNDHWSYKQTIIDEDNWRLHKEYAFFRQYREGLKQNKPMPKSYFNHFLKRSQIKEHPNSKKLYDVDNLNMEIVKKLLIPKKKFKDKAPLLFWRGARSGGFNHFQKERGYPKKAVERGKIIEHFKENFCKNIDILYVEHPSLTLLEILDKANRDHKYLLDLQGNDVGSNSYWIYKKDCIVFRPDFLKSYNAWDCHLEPWVHYVPFSHENYGDLVDKIKWCEKNTGKCEIIIKNANNLHALMYDTKHREEVYTEMYKKIKENLIIS